jgi:hypothetical protein
MPTNMAPTSIGGVSAVPPKVNSATTQLVSPSATKLPRLRMIARARRRWCSSRLLSAGRMTREPLFVDVRTGWRDGNSDAALIVSA